MYTIEIGSLPNEIKMYRICTTNLSCGSGEMVNGATGGEFVIQDASGEGRDDIVYESEASSSITILVHSRI